MAQNLNVLNQIKSLATTLQFYWFLGHLFVLLGSALHLATFLRYTIFYRLAYIGAFLSYGIIVFLKYKNEAKDLALLMRASKDEDLFYLILAVVWFFTSPITITLVPFFLYSLFHSINYLSNVFLITLFPYINTEIAEKKVPASTPTQVVTYLNTVHKTYNTLSIKKAIEFEVTAIPLFLFVSLITFQVSLFTCLFYGWYLTNRYNQSLLIKEAFHQLVQQMDHLIASSYVPQVVKSVYYRAKEAIKSLKSRIPN